MNRPNASDPTPPETQAGCTILLALRLTSEICSTGRIVYALQYSYGAVQAQKDRMHLPYVLKGGGITSSCETREVKIGANAFNIWSRPLERQHETR